MPRSPKFILYLEIYPMSDLRDAYKELLARYRWQWFCTLTFRTPPHPEAAHKKFRFWISQINRELYGRTWYKKKKSVYWALALEYHKSGVIHFHALLGDNVNLDETLKRKWAADRWFQIGGFSRISPIPFTEDGQRLMIVGYVAKYVSKGGQIDLSDNLGQFITFIQE